MGTLAQARTTVDNWLAARWPTVTGRQQTYYDNHSGHYWQGLVTHTDIPFYNATGDGDSIGDKLTSTPTDQLYNWNDIFPEFSGTQIPCALWFDVYDGPLGKGYVGNIEVNYSGIIYTRSQNVGPESGRTDAWHVVTSGIFI